MKKILFLLATTAMLALACNKTAPVGPTMANVTVQLTLDGKDLAKADVEVTAVSENNVTFKEKTDASGAASLMLPAGTYTFNAFFKEVKEDKKCIYNASKKGQLNLGENSVALPLVESFASDIIIKELYNGGCMDNDGAKNYQYDKYIIIYNNSDKEVDISNMCIAMGPISSSKSSNKYAVAGDDNSCTYYAEGWMPASYSIWWFQSGVEVKLPAYSQILVAINKAIDHTQTYTNSVDLSKAEYYCMYDPEAGFTNASYYGTPSANIPTTHYMKTYLFGMGNAWAFPMQMAAPFLIMPGSSMEDFVKNTANFDNKGSNKSSNYCKIPQSWVLDALDLWSSDDQTQYFKRFAPTIDCGYKVFAVNKNGSTIYRNVDKEATEAIAENAGKLVYGYAGNLNPDDGDPSGIDAEASIARGAKIVYSETNNCGKDFHIRKVASIKK